MTLKERYAGVVGWFLEHMPEAGPELHYRTPYELLVAVMLSAQCTDKRVNLVTPAFFRRFPDAQTLAGAQVQEVLTYVKSISYPNAKARHLVAMARRLEEAYGGSVPDSVEALQTLPGVGRKTANVIVSVVYRQPAMAVDTHVFRVAERVGLTTRSRGPLQTEKTLVRHIPRRLLGLAHHWFILHGRYICAARAPKCSTCGLQPWCRLFLSKKV